MKKIFANFIIFVSIVTLSSAINMPIPEIVETSPSTSAQIETETKAHCHTTQIEINFVPVISELTYPQHINLLPQLEVLEFLKPPSLSFISFLA